MCSKYKLFVKLAMITVVSVFLVSQSALAAPITNSFGLASPTSTLTFDEIVFPANTVITNQYAAYGVTFSPSLQYDTQSLPLGIEGIMGHFLGNASPLVGGGVINPFSFNFIWGGAQSDAAFGLATNPGTTTLTALLGGVLVESFSLMTTYNDPSTSFLGFSGILFDEIRININSDDGLDLALIDNIQSYTGPTTTSIPEPATLALMSLGLVGFGFKRRNALSPDTAALPY